MDEHRSEDLAQLAIDAFNVFGFDSKQWPDVVQINRSGYTDVNIRGIWAFEDRVEFFNAPLPQLQGDVTDNMGLYPGSSGATD